MAATAQIVKTYFDGSVDIDTMSVDEARAHVVSRTEAPDAFGIKTITVKIEGTTHRYDNGEGWAWNNCKHLGRCMNVYVGRRCALVLTDAEAFEQIKS